MLFWPPAYRNDFWDDSRFVTFVIVEHFILFVKIAIDVIIPDIPRSISRALVWKEVIGNEVLKKLKEEAAESGDITVSRGGGEWRARGGGRVILNQE